MSGTFNLTFHKKPLRGENAINIALVGIPNSGKSTLFEAVSSTQPKQAALTGTQQHYRQCMVEVGLNEVCLIDLPSIQSLHQQQGDELVTLKYLLWGDQRPLVSRHENPDPPAPYAPPDVIIQVVDATALERHLELTQELSLLGRPLVVALNHMDEAQAKGLTIDCRQLQQRLGAAVVATTASMGQGITELFKRAVQQTYQRSCPLPPVSKHLQKPLQQLAESLPLQQLQAAFHIPGPLMMSLLASGDTFIQQELQEHHPSLLIPLQQKIEQISATLPRPLGEELHAERHHQAALLAEAISHSREHPVWQDWRWQLDRLFLHPHWGLLGSLLVFAGVLFVVFEISSWLDSITAAKLIELLEPWQPSTTGGVIGRAVVDGLVGLIGIVIPYMLPLVLLLVSLEQSGIMHRIAFVMDRGFHKIGLHGGISLSFLLGLGCNVPAISTAAAATSGRERLIASLLITFVPCSARSAIILALAGKYLGGLAVLAIFLLTLIVIAVMGQLLSRYLPKSGPGQLQEIPPYKMPKLRPLLQTTWLRTRDILTIVTPLLVGGSIILALLSHVGAEAWINWLLTPITGWWLGLPIVLGVPILFGILRKELSLLMVYQALGSFDISAYMDWVQITTFLIFLTFYIPCVSTFAIMLKVIGLRHALFSITLSVVAALLLSGVIRALLEGGRWAFG